MSMQAVHDLVMCSLAMGCIGGLLGIVALVIDRPRKLNGKSRRGRSAHDHEKEVEP